MRIYTLSCGHSDSGTLSPGVMTMCPVCLCYARITAVISQWSTPISDAIVNMVFDAICTWNTRAPNAASLPLDLTVEVKARFREALGLEGRPSPAPVGASTGPANPINGQGGATRCLRALVEFFNTPEGYTEFGHDGDMDDLPPEQTAIRGLKGYSRGKKAYDNLLKDMQTAQRDVAALQERYDRDMETTRNERNQAQARVGSFVLDVRDLTTRRHTYETVFKTILNDIGIALGEIPLKSAGDYSLPSIGLDLRSLKYMIEKALK